MKDKYIGRLLDGRYEILEVIGVGGMAVVYKAMCHRLNRLVAVKILKDEFSRDEEFRRRFHAESQAVAMMSHPNIVNVYDISKSEGLDYIVMELIDGITLKQYMEKKGALSWRETLHFSMQIAKALDHAHSRGIIHRDIKPHNIMILKDGSVKVADFGIARVASAQNTLTKEALGSVHYISPEQAKGARVDTRTDLYSLGVVMYQMLTGRPPYDGETPVAVAIQHINGTPLLPILINNNIPIGLEQITMHAMCAELNNRYPSAAEMLRDMEEFRKNPAVHFTFVPGGETQRSAAQPAPVSRTPVSRQTSGNGSYRQPEASRRTQMDADRREERNKRIMTIVIVAVAIAALIGVVLLVTSLLNNAGTTEPMTETTDPTVPNFVGMAWDDIDADDYPDFVLTSESEFNNEYDQGIVCRQSIDADSVVKSGREILLTVSRGKKTLLSEVTEQEAIDYFKNLNMNISTRTEEEFDETIEAGRVIRTEPTADRVKDGDTVTIFVSKGPELVKVPMLEGLSRDTAIALIKSEGLICKASEEYHDQVPEGDVISQDPKPDTEVKSNTVVNIIVSKGVKTIKMPYVISMDEASANTMLDSMGLKVTIQSVYDSTQAGYVIAQNRAEGTELKAGDSVILTVSKGPEPTEPTTAATEPTTVPPETVATP